MGIRADDPLPVIEIDGQAAEIRVFGKKYSAGTDGLYGCPLGTSHICSLMGGTGLAVEDAAPAEGAGDATRYRACYGQSPALFRARGKGLLTALTVALYLSHGLGRRLYVLRFDFENAFMPVHLERHDYEIFLFLGEGNRKYVGLEGIDGHPQQKFCLPAFMFGVLSGFDLQCFTTPAEGGCEGLRILDKNGEGMALAHAFRHRKFSGKGRRERAEECNDEKRKDIFT